MYQQLEFSTIYQSLWFSSTHNRSRRTNQLSSFISNIFVNALVNCNRILRSHLWSPTMFLVSFSINFFSFFNKTFDIKWKQNFFSSFTIKFLFSSFFIYHVLNSLLFYSFLLKNRWRSTTIFILSLEIEVFSFLLRKKIEKTVKWFQKAFMRLPTVTVKQ